LRLNFDWPLDHGGYIQNHGGFIPDHGTYIPENME
jgi:hypothetical protein